MIHLARSLSLTREQASRLQGYLQTYWRYAFASLLPSVQRNMRLRLLQVLQGKLEAMKQSDQVCFTTFDYNEETVISAAIQLYLLDLGISPQDVQRVKERRHCQQIAAFFATDLS